jgi:beta-galactosidase
LQGLGSANSYNEESFTSSEHTTYYGRALVVVRAGLKSGTVKVTVSAEGCEMQALTIPVE